MEFRTKIPLQPKKPTIDHHSKVLLLGSCFVENIGKKMEYYKFRTLQNPFGILFHPASIAGFLEKVNSGNTFSEEDLFFHNERWHSFDAHSALSRPEKGEILQQLNSGIEQTHRFLEEASHVIITLGTAWAYQLVETGKTVANCHKLPQKYFTKELVEADSYLKNCVNIIRCLNPKTTVIFTVSPIRHLKDGFVENQQSKARLINAVHELISSEENTAYFPSYEFMMDELRDYRFYEADMLHPSQTAINYIWEKFVETWMSMETAATLEEIEKIQKGLSHRPFNAASEAHKSFVKTLEHKIKALEQKFPYMHF